MLETPVILQVGSQTNDDIVKDKIIVCCSKRRKRRKKINPNC